MGDFQKKRVPDDSQAPIVPLDSDHAYGIRRTKIEHTSVSKPQPMDCPAYLRELNPAQRAAAEYDVSDIAGGPLLVIAGAGTGKTGPAFPRTQPSAGCVALKKQN